MIKKLSQNFDYWLAEFDYSELRSYTSKIVLLVYNADIDSRSYSSYK